jgi:signal transduction histidine kinase
MVYCTIIIIIVIITITISILSSSLSLSSLFIIIIILFIYLFLFLSSYSLLSLIFEIFYLMFFDWVSFLAYPILFGIKGFVVVVVVNLTKKCILRKTRSDNLASEASNLIEFLLY